MNKLISKILMFFYIKILKFKLYLTLKEIGFNNFEKFLVKNGWTKEEILNKRIYTKKDSTFTIIDNAYYK